MITAHWLGSSIADRYLLEVIESTPASIDGSIMIIEPAKNDEWYTYSFFFLWQPTSGGEDDDIILRAQSTDGTDFTIDQIVMVSLKVSDLASTDFYYDSDTTDFNLSTISVGAWSTANNATISFTPDNAGDTWLVGTSAWLDDPDLSDLHVSGISINGSNPISSGGTVIKDEGEDTTEQEVMTVFQTFVLYNTEQTFREEFSNQVDDVGIRKLSQVFALRLNVFEQFKAFFNHDQISISATDFGTQAAATTAITSHTGDVFMLGQVIWDNLVSGINHDARLRTSASPVDSPATQTSDNYQFSGFQDIAEELPWQILNVTDFGGSNNGAIVHVGSGNTVQGMVEDRLALVFTMELASTGHDPITATDIPTITDNATKDASFVRSATDTPTITDSTSEINHYVRTGTDTPTITDSATKDANFVRSATDTPSITDNGIKTFTRSTTDIPTITDNATKDASFVRTATDTPSLTDSATKDANFVRTATDTPTITDSANFVFIRTGTDTPTITDSTSEINHYVRTGTDTPTITDSYLLEISVIETPSITDSATKDASFVRTATDTPSLTDNGSAGLTRTGTDTPTITDSASAVQTHNSISATDIPTITDNGIKTFTRSVTDTPTITDSTSEINHYARTTTDIPTITDSATKDASFVRTGTDTPSLTDSATKDASFVRTATNTPSLTDSASAVQTHNSISATDIPTITDNGIKTFTRSVTDTPTITDSASTGTMFSRTATDTPTITDSATKDASFVRTATDTPSLTDNGSTGLTRTGTDTPTITDSVIVDISVFEPSGKYIWFNLAPPETDRLGGVYAFECPTGQFIYTIHTNGTVSCRVP